MRICIFGDSIVWGANDWEKGGWAERLKVHYLKGFGIGVYNLGVDGDDSRTLLVRAESEIDARGADIIIFSIGINDSQHILGKQGPRVSMEDFKGNIEKLAIMARRYTDRVFFVGLYSVDESKTRPIPWNRAISYTNDSIRTYDSAIRDLCQKEGLAYIDTKDTIMPDDLDDGLHPGSQGHAKIAERVKSEVNALIGQYLDL